MSELTALSTEIGKMSGNMINNPHFIFDSLSSPSYTLPWDFHTPVAGPRRLARS